MAYVSYVERVLRQGLMLLQQAYRAHICPSCRHVEAPGSPHAGICQLLYKMHVLLCAY